jgi:23S rRNA pseudouridine1911/1915/1917 synthase
VTLRSEIKPVLSATEAACANGGHDFAIVAERDDFIVVEKPPFLLVHPTKPTSARTLWGELKQLLAFEIANGGQISIVNRLDRETSGLVLVAKTALAARRFGLLMQEQRIAKEYLAIVWGWPDWESRTVDSPLVRQGVHLPSPIWLKQTIHPLGALARTDFRVEERFTRGANGERFSIIRAFPRTGRTHQIRVHLEHLGHPVIGDPVYGGGGSRRISGPPRRAAEALERATPRQALHAAALAFRHPATGEPLEFRSDWPADLRPALLALGGEDLVARPDPLSYLRFFNRDG